MQTAIRKLSGPLVGRTQTLYLRVGNATTALVGRHTAAGLMFWFIRKRFPGSYVRLICASRW